MSLFFPNAKIRVYRYTETGDYDDDGEPEFVNKFIAEYIADIQKKDLIMKTPNMVMNKKINI